MSYTIRIRNADTVQEFVIPGVRLDWRAYRTDDNQTMLVIEGVEIGPIPGGPCDNTVMDVLAKVGKNYSPAMDINIDIHGNYANVYTNDPLVHHPQPFPRPNRFLNPVGQSLPFLPASHPIMQWVCEADNPVAFNQYAEVATYTVKVKGSKAARYAAVVTRDPDDVYRYPQGIGHAPYVGGVQINVGQFTSPTACAAVCAFLRSLSPERIDAFVRAANHHALPGIGLNYHYLTMGCVIIDVETSAPDVSDEVTEDQQE